MQQLTISFDTEDGLDGELTAVVQSHDFAGKSAAWFSIHQLREFGELLGAFPIMPGKEPTLAGGFWNKDGSGLDQAHVFIRIEPTGLRGKLLVKVELTTPVWDFDQSERQSVQAELLVNYADLGTFQRALSTLLDGEAPEARLEATST